jgi:hypothetical protein
VVSARDIDSIDASGVLCTPTFFINGTRHASRSCGLSTGGKGIDVATDPSGVTSTDRCSWLVLRCPS